MIAMANGLRWCVDVCERIKVTHRAAYVFYVSTHIYIRSDWAKKKQKIKTHKKSNTCFVRLSLRFEKDK